MTLEQVQELTIKVNEKVKSKNEDELIGWITRLELSIHKANAKDTAKVAMEIALVVAFIQEL